MGGKTEIENNRRIIRERITAENPETRKKCEKWLVWLVKETGE
mgnify:CR=1 FL=1